MFNPNPNPPPAEYAPRLRASVRSRTTLLVVVPVFYRLAEACPLNFRLDQWFWQTRVGGGLVVLSSRRRLWTSPRRQGHDPSLLLADDLLQTVSDVESLFSRELSYMQHRARKAKTGQAIEH